MVEKVSVAFSMFCSNLQLVHLGDVTSVLDLHFKQGLYLKSLEMPHIVASSVKSVDCYR